MDNFYNLRAEKQEHIINAALNVFGKNGYKKASVADIATEAGIAKGMINYYFGSKKNLYLYLAEYSFKNVTAAMNERFIGNITDLFEKMKVTTAIKVDVMKEHPAMFSFLASFYNERDIDVADEVALILEEGKEFREKWLFDGIDFSKFKDDVDPVLLDKFLVWAAEGFTKNLRDNMDVAAIEDLTKDLFEMLDIMQKYFYRY